MNLRNVLDEVIEVYTMKVLLFFLFLLCLLFTTFREGFELPSIGGSIGEYDYLKPVPTPTVLDTTTETDFINAYSTATSAFPAFNPKTNTAFLKSLKTDVTVDEFKYYITNNKWPYGSYITNYITTNKDAVLARFKAWNITTLDDLQKLFPTRTVYAICINPLESTITPLPVSNNIFTGKSDSSVPSSSTSSLSPDNFTKLKSICSSI